MVSDELLRTGNIAMHFSVNPGSGQALLNSRTGKTWNTEERTSRGILPRPLLQNQEFKICIEVQPNQYQISVNNRDFLKFLHRHPYESVGLLSYEGDFEISNVQIQPYVSPDVPYIEPALLANNDHIINDLKFPRLPLLLPIKNGLTIGMMIHIDGRLTGNRFDVSFYQGSDPYGDPNSNVAFHMEVYLSERSIIRNSNQNKEWRTPESEMTHFPFFGHSIFSMIIRVESNRYQVIVGGHYVFDFKHRITLLDTIDHLGIHGSVELTNVTISVPPL